MFNYTNFDMRVGTRVPDTNFMTRVRDESMSIISTNPFKWETKTTADYFAGKRVVIFSVPGAFTPTCSTMQLPSFEREYLRFKQEFNIDEIYCISVNDTFVMNSWVKQQNIENVKIIPDGNASFTESMGMLVDKNNYGFGKRSWRYAAVVDDGIIEAWFEEPGICDNCETDPYGQTDPKNILNYLEVYAVEKERA
jgi:peroxiredoxin